MIKILNAYVHKGYNVVHVEGKGSVKLCHVVLDTLTGHWLPKGMVIHHIDEDKMNDSPWNLAVLTDSQHKFIHGKKRLGKKYKQPKVVVEQPKHVRNQLGYKNPMYGKHPIAWNRGLTKETSEGIRLSSDARKGKPQPKGIKRPRPKKNN